MAGLEHAPSIRNLPSGEMENIKKMFESEEGKSKPNKPRDASPVVSMRHKTNSPRPVPRKVLPVHSAPVKLKHTFEPPPGDSTSNIKTEQQLMTPSAENTDIVNKAHVTPSILKRISALQDPDSNKDDHDNSSKLTKPARPKWMKNVEEATESTADEKPVASSRVGKREIKSCIGELSSVTNTAHPVFKSKTDECLYKPEKVDKCVSAVKSELDVSSEKPENSNLKQFSGIQTDTSGDKQDDSKNSKQRNSGGIEVIKIEKVIEGLNEGQNKKNPTKSSLAPPRPAQLPRPRPRSVRQNSIGCASEYEYTPIWVEPNKQFTFKNTQSTEVVSKPKTFRFQDKASSVVSSTSVPSGAPRKGTQASSSARPGAPPPPPPPRKPPRTGAHDIYIETKLHKSKEVEIMDNVLYVPLETDNQDETYKSVKSRVSSLLESQLHSKDDSVIHRHTKLHQPPVPKRPISIATDCMNISQALSCARVKPDLPRPIHHEYEEIEEKEDRPAKGNAVRAAVDMLTQRPLQRFPLRKSFSSDNLCFVNTSDVPVYIDPALSKGFDKFRGDRYEAYVDDEGYAIPHAFVKKHAGEKLCLDESLVSLF